MYPIRVVTISRQIGSMGFAIGKLVAQNKGWQFVCREAINQAAIRAGTPQAALAMIDEFNLFGFKLTPDEHQAYIQSIAKVMSELAEQGSIVILGRAGQVILADRPDTLHVRIAAPAEIRAHRLAERHKISLQAAKAQIAASDKYRSTYLKRFYNVDWKDPNLYDLIINTARITQTEAADLIQILIDRGKNG